MDIKIHRSNILLSEMDNQKKRGPVFTAFHHLRRRVCTVRFMIGVLLCMAFACVHIMNTNLSMAIVCMVNNSNPIHPLNNITLEMEKKCPSGYSVESLEMYRGPLDWSSQMQGILFAATNIGRLLMIFTGWVSDKFNAKYLLMISVILSSGANLAMPVVAMTGSNVYPILLRVVVGIGDGFLQPCVNSLLVRWFPIQERSSVLALVTGGRQIGTLLILPVAGYLCSSTQILGGWPAIFYLPSILSVLWLALWIPFGADKPNSHCFISLKEKGKIATANAAEQLSEKRKDRKVPWKDILTSPAVWSAAISVVCHELPLMTLLMFLPSYMHDVLLFDPRSNGIFSALPTASFLITKLMSARLARSLIRTFNMSPTCVSRLLNAIGSLGLGIFLAAVTLLDCTQASWAVVFLCLSMGFTGLHTPGCVSALVSIAPAYSGTVTGITFFLVAASGSANALGVKALVTNGLKAEWDVVFLSSASVALLPVVIFSIWGSADLQPWATERDKELNNDDNISQTTDTTNVSHKSHLSPIHILNPKSILKSLAP